MIKPGPILLKTHLKGLIEELEASDARIVAERELQKAALDASKDAHGTEPSCIRRLVAFRRRKAKNAAETTRLEDIEDQYRFMVEGGVPPAYAPEVVDELSRVLALTNTSKPPKIEAIKKALGCSQGKAHKLRSLAAVRLASGVKSSSSSAPRELEHLPDHDADGVITDASREGASGTAKPEGQAAPHGAEAKLHAAAERFMDQADCEVSVEVRAAPGSLLDRVGEALERVAPGRVQRNLDQSRSPVLDASAEQPLNAGNAADVPTREDGSAGERDTRAVEMVKGIARALGGEKLTLVNADTGDVTRHDLIGAPSQESTAGPEQDAATNRAPSDDALQADRQEPPAPPAQGVGSCAGPDTGGPASGGKSLFQRITGAFHDPIVAHDPKPLRVVADEDDLEIPGFLDRRPKLPA